MAYQSVHSGPAIDAAVTQLADIQEVRVESNANLAAVQSLAAEVSTNASTASAAAASATTALSNATATIAAADHARQEQIDAEIAIVADQRFAAEQAATEAVAAADAAVVTVTQDMAASVPTPNKLPLAGADGKIASDWLGDDIARAADVVRGDALAAADGSGLVGFQQAGVGAVARTMQDKAREVVSVKDFGAVGDGVADDTAAIQAADSSGAPCVRFPGGTYKAAQLQQTTSWVMEPGAKLLYAGAPDAGFIECTASGIKGNIEIDGGGAQLRYGIKVSGSSNAYSKIDVRNVASASGITVGIELMGDNNHVETIEIHNFANSGNTNDSMPQGVAIGGDGNSVDLFLGRQIATAVVTGAASGQTSVRVVDVVGATDNGVYILGGSFSAEAINYYGSDEPLVVSSGSAFVAALNVLSAGNAALGLSNAAEVSIGRINLRNAGVNSILKTRTDNVASGHVSIGAVVGEFTGETLMGALNGTIESLEVSEVSVTYFYDAALSNLSQFCNLAGCKSFAIKNWNIRCVDLASVLASGSYFLVSAPTSNIDRQSFAQSIDVSVYASDGATPSAAGARLQNFANALISTKGFRWQVNIGPYGRDVPYADADTISGIPVGGYWKRGKLLWNGAPSASQPAGWACVASGTPGTWTAMASLSA
jgi:hypothetical protein